VIRPAFIVCNQNLFKLAFIDYNLNYTKDPPYNRLNINHTNSFPLLWSQHLKRRYSLKTRSHANWLNEKGEPEGYKVFCFIRRTYQTLKFENLSTGSYQDARISSLLITILFFLLHNPSCVNVCEISSTFLICNHYDVLFIISYIYEAWNIGIFPTGIIH